MAVADLRRMSLWQFRQVFTGWRQANRPPEGPAPPTAEDFANANWDF